MNFFWPNKLFKNLPPCSSVDSITMFLLGGARGVIVIVVGNGHGDSSSNPGRD